MSKMQIKVTLEYTLWLLNKSPDDNYKILCWEFRLSSSTHGARVRMKLLEMLSGLFCEAGEVCSPCTTDPQLEIQTEDCGCLQQHHKKERKEEREGGWEEGRREKRLEERKEKEISFVIKPEQSWYFHGNVTGLQLQQQGWAWKIQLKSGMEKHAFNSSNARRLWVPDWFLYTA